MTAAIIIARGGSKRLPGKNVKLFCGVPLVAWSIIQAKCSHLIDEVYLSTDDDEIADVGERYGATIIRRPDWPDADLLQGSAPMIHAVETIQAQRDDLDVTVPILPTNPCFYPDDMDRMVKRWHELNDIGVAVYMAAPLRYIRILRDLGDGGWAHAIHDKTAGKYLVGGSHRSVWGPEFHLEFMRGSAMYDRDMDAIFAARGFVEDPPLIHERWVHCKLWQTNVDVDTLEEFEFGEAMMEHYILKGRGPDIYYEYAEDYTQFIGNARQL